MQLKWTQAGSSALQQQLKRIDAIVRGAAAEVDAIGEQQLCIELSGTRLLT